MAFFYSPEWDIDPAAFFRYNRETALPEGDDTPRLFPEPRRFFRFVPTYFDGKELPLCIFDCQNAFWLRRWRGRWP